MKTTKKLLAILLAMLMLCGVAAISASANNYWPYSDHGDIPQIAQFCECSSCRSNRAFEEMKAQLRRQREYWLNAWRNERLLEILPGHARLAFDNATKTGTAIIEDRGEYILVIDGPWSKTQYEPIAILRTEEPSLEAIKKNGSKEFAEKYLAMADLDKEFAPQLKAAGFSSMASLISIAAIERVSILRPFGPFGPFERPNCGCACHFFGGPIHVQPCCYPGFGLAFSRATKFVTDKEARPYFEVATSDGIITVAADDVFMKQLAADGIKLLPETVYESKVALEVGKAGEAILTEAKLEARKAEPKDIDEVVNRAPARGRLAINISFESRLMRDKDGNWYRVNVLYVNGEAVSVMVFKF